MRSNTFKFQPIYEKVPSTWCLIKIDIGEIINEDNNSCFKIIYTNTFPENLIKYQVNNAHPFYKNEELIEHMYGETIIKNKMTESIIELLLMDLKELGKKVWDGNSLKLGAE